MLFAAPTLAQVNAPIGGGGECSQTTEPDGTQGDQQGYDGGLYTCTGLSVWAPEAVIIGDVDANDSSPSCNSTNAGMIEYSGGIFYGCNGSNWTSFSSGGPGVLISTQTSSSSNITFSNLPATYNTLFLNCAGLLTTNLKLIVGEGSSPITWETGAHYTVQTSHDETSNGWSSTTTATDALDITGLLATSSTPVSLKFYIDNVGSTSLYKVYTYSMASTQGSVFNTNSSWGYWNNDTGAITGIEVLFGGTSSGTCSLYGLD
jgi:hypothetical protein